MKDDDVITITVERVPFGLSIYTTDSATRRSLLAAYHEDGFHLMGAKRRTDGVFYRDDYLNDILDLLACGDGDDDDDDDDDDFSHSAISSLIRETYHRRGSVVVGLPAAVAMPLLGLKDWKRLMG